MPIKACTRCGLKVLVDAAVAAQDTYLCPRCAPDAAGSGSAPAPKPAGGKRPSVKVTCPYCGASFSGSKPSRPAKGGCPVCQKELVLLPDGTIQAAATFNLATWQKERKSASNPPAPAPATSYDAPPEMPSTPDPLGGSTILDMGGPPGGAPPPPPSLEDQTMALPGGIGGETMLGMGHDMAAPPPPAPSIEEPAPAPPMDVPEAPPDLGGATILDMGSRAPEAPAPDIEEPPPSPDLLSETMPGMDRPPSAESPVEPPIAPPIPEEPDVTEGPTIRDADVAPPEEEHPESVPVMEENADASIESAPEIPADLGGQTILGLGGTEDLPPRQPEPAPSIEEPPPEAVPILAKDVPGVEPEAPAEEAPAPGQATPKPYVYQPIPRVPRKPPPSTDPVPVGPPPMQITRSPGPGPQPGPPPAASQSAPVLGSDFRIAAAPPPPPRPISEERRGEKKPAGPQTAAIIMPRAHHTLGKMIFAWVLLLLPLAVGFAFYSARESEGAGRFIQKVRDQVKPGIQKTEGEIKKAVTKPEEPAKQ